MTIPGVDYAFPPHPSIPGLAAAGMKFASRYGGWVQAGQNKGPGTSDKWLTPDEAKALSAAGLSIVANAEGSAGGLTGGYSTGFSWAKYADLGFKACGMPSDRPIYLSVDFDVTTSTWPAVRDALRGAADALGGVHRVGVYGGRHAVEWARRDGVAAWFWQTYAWSGGVWVPGNHVEQYHNGVQVAGADVDLNRALKSDFGQWQVGMGDDMFCAFGDSLSPKVEAMQRLIIAAGGDLSHAGGPDGNYGNGTAAQLAAVIGVGDGHTYGPTEYAALMVKLAGHGAGASGPKGDPGPAGPVGPQGPAGPIPTMVEIRQQATVIAVA